MDDVRLYYDLNPRRGNTQHYDNLSSPLKNNEHRNPVIISQKGNSPNNSWIPLSNFSDKSSQTFILNNDNNTKTIIKTQPIIIDDNDNNTTIIKDDNKPVEPIIVLNNVNIDDEKSGIEPIEGKTEIQQYPITDIYDHQIELSLGEVEELKYNEISLKDKIDWNHHIELPTNSPITNYYDNFINIYTKGLPHNKDGYVDIIEINKLILAIKNKNKELLSLVNGSLLDPSAIWSEDLIGNPINTYIYSKPHNFCSGIITNDMIELYSMSLVRDVIFDDFPINSLISELCEITCSTPYNIFRGPMYGDLQGYYISQFLLNKSHKMLLPNKDYNINWNNIIDIQSKNQIKTPINGPIRQISTGRDLASYIYSVNPFEPYINTLEQLINLSEMNKYLNFGLIDIQSIITLVGRNALLVAWNIKWNNLVLRPEALGIEISRCFREKKNKSGLSIKLLNHEILNKVYKINSSRLLSQCYMEGSPNCPSAPSEEGVLAGACITVLKFYFASILKKEIDIIYPIDIGCKSCVIDELHKLASNIALSTVWAGTNYRHCAISGLKLGEKVAISCLKDIVMRYTDTTSIKFPSFNNKEIIISNKFI